MASIKIRTNDRTIQDTSLCYGEPKPLKTWCLIINITLSVNVSSGECRIQGKYLSSSTTTNVHISANTGSYNRYDLIVVDISDGGNIKAIQGAPSSNPTIPSASSNQIILAKVLVGSGVSSIQSSNITDLRDANNQYFMESLDKSIHVLENRATDIEKKLATKREFTGSGAVKK